jgi:hypothetical protein
MPVCAAVDATRGSRLTRAGPVGTLAEPAEPLDVKEREGTPAPPHLVDARGHRTDTTAIEVRRPVPRIDRRAAPGRVGPTASGATNGVGGGIVRRNALPCEDLGVVVQGPGDLDAAERWAQRVGPRDPAGAP